MENLIEKKQKEAAQSRNNAIKWSLIIIIPLLVLLGVYLIWGLSGLSSTCYVFTFIFGLIAFVGTCFKEDGCLTVVIISGAVAFGLGSLGGYLEKLSTISTKDNSNDVFYIVDNDYDAYIDNQLMTGSKPFNDYYNSLTGDNYLDFKTSGCDYVVIVRDYNSSDVVNHVYIRAEDTGRLYLPNGTYNIYFYGGKGWNPEMQNGNVKGGFVSEGHVQKDGPVDLYNQCGVYTLYPVQDGNLQLQKASKDEAL